MRALVIALVAACGYTSPQVGEDAPRGDAIDGPDSSGGCWSYVPTNFDACRLAPNPVAITVDVPMTISDATSLPHKIVAQSDGSEIVVVHLTTLTVNNVLTIDGAVPIVLAVDGGVTINSIVDVRAGADDSNRCMGGVTGGGGTGSNNPNGGGGGGGGGGAAETGGDGGDGDGIMNGTKGSAGKQVAGADALSPMRAGCAGGAGGRHNGSGTPGTGGAGGGGLQISTNAILTLDSSGSVVASGFGGGIATVQTGGGGGGSGGAVLLEGPHIVLDPGSVVCADGGSGSEGGGATTSSAAGIRSPCVGTIGATTMNTTFGGNGGPGGFRSAPVGGPGLAGESSNAGGGGGGGGAGWIRIRSVSPAMMSGIVTPTARID